MCKRSVYLRRTDCVYVAGCGFAGATNIIEHLAFLHASEIFYYDALQHDRQKKNYLLGRVAAKKAIAALMPDVPPQDIFIDRGVFGFPVVKGAITEKIQVSISHCDDAGIALAYPEAHPLGVDLEKIDADKTEAIKLVMTAVELKDAMQSELSFEQYSTITWTAKEALSKILRTGLTMDYKLLELKQLIKTENFNSATFKNFGQYKAISYCCGQYVCSIVLPKNSEADWGEVFEVLDGLIG